MSNPFIGEVFLFAGNFAPRGWAFCDGQLLPIASYQALFSILGTTYGGDGRTTFALPDLRGRAPVGPRQGAGLSNVQLGERSGSETVTLTPNQIPSHTHALLASQDDATRRDPTGLVPARTSEKAYDSGSGGTSVMDATAVGNTGGGQAHNNMQPFLGMHYIIALEGTFPSRS